MSDTVTVPRAALRKMMDQYGTAAVLVDAEYAISTDRDTCWDEWKRLCVAVSPEVFASLDDEGEGEEPSGAGADPYGRTAEDWAHHAE